MSQKAGRLRKSVAFSFFRYQSIQEQKSYGSYYISYLYIEYIWLLYK